MKPKITALADNHLRNDDPYGVEDDRGVNDFLLIRYEATKKAIKITGSDGHLAIVGDFLDSNLVDSHTLYYSSQLVQLMNELRFAILLEGNHGYDDRRGTFSAVAHWKHLASKSLRVVTYPRIERKDGIAYHCVPALSDVESNFLKIVGKLSKKIKKGDTNVLLLHAPITGAKFESGAKSTGGIPAEHIRRIRERYDFVVCGDLHKYQKLYDNVWYCGSIIQASLKDKGQPRGFQVIDPNTGTYKFVSSGGPRFYDLKWEVGKAISKMLKAPENYKDDLKGAVVVVRLIGLTRVVDKISRDEIREKLKAHGAFRVFVDTKRLDAKSERQTIRSDTGDEEMIQEYCKQRKEELPGITDAVANKGLQYLKAGAL